MVEFCQSPNYRSLAGWLLAAPLLCQQLYHKQLPPPLHSGMYECQGCNSYIIHTLLVFLQGTAGPDPTTVFVDMRALRHDR